MNPVLNEDEGRLRFLRRATDRPRHRFRRGVYLLPSLFTLGNMFCGYACVVYAMRGEYETAAPFIGFAITLDMLDGRIARLTGTASAFGLEFDSLADVISFGIAPAILSFAWGLSPLGRLASTVLLSTLLHASDADYRLVVIKDCCADLDAQLHACLIEKLFPRRATVMSAADFLETMSRS